MRETWSEAELAYFAGIVDGEGTLGLHKKRGSGTKRYHDFVLNVSNTDERLLEWLQETFGGARGIGRVGRGNHKTLYRWYLHSARAEVVLRAAMPYLILKREVAELVLEHRATMTRGGKRVTDEIFAERERIFARVRVLNHRGTQEVPGGVFLQ